MRLRDKGSKNCWILRVYRVCLPQTEFFFEIMQGNFSRKLCKLHMNLSSMYLMILPKNMSSIFPINIVYKICMNEDDSVCKSFFCVSHVYQES